jgi:hypothetical protein
MRHLPGRHLHGRHTEEPSIVFVRIVADPAKAA